MDVFDLYAKIALDTSEYESGLEGASGKTSSFASKLKSGIGTACKVGAAAVGAVTTAVGAVSGTIAKGVSDVAAYGDNIDKMSQKMGMSASSYQEWDAVMQHCGTSIESMQSSMKTLASAAETGNDAFAKLGISQQEIANMNQEELFSATITALQNVDSETERTYLAGKLLGRGATELGPLLNTSAEDTQAMKDRVHELGGVMSDDAVKAAAAFQDSLQDLKTGFSGAKNAMLGEFLPSCTKVMDGLTELFAGNGSAGISLISEGISEFSGKLSESLPSVLNAGAEIVTSLLTAVTTNLPQLIGAGTDAVTTLATGVLDNLPQIATAAVQAVGTFVQSIGDSAPDLLNAGLEALVQLCDGIISGLPDMIDRLPEIIEGILNFITENLPSIFEKGGELLINLSTGIIQAIPHLLNDLPDIIRSITKFISDNLPTIVESGIDILLNLAIGIIDAIPDLVKQLPEIITAIVDALADGVEDMKKAGKDLLEGIWNGISDKVEWLKGKVSGVVDKIKSWFTGKDGFDEHSPSKWSRKVFSYVLEGAGLGLDEEAPALYRNVSGIVNRVREGFDMDAATVDFSASGSGRIASALQRLRESGEEVFNITVQSVLDGKIIAEDVTRRQRQRARAYGEV